MGANDPQGGAIFDPRGMIGRIYKKDHYTLLLTKYEGSGPCGFGEDFFMFCPITPQGAWLAGFIKRTTIHCYTQKNERSGTCGFGEEDFFLCFFHCKSMGAICCHGNQSSNQTWPKT